MTAASARQGLASTSQAGPAGAVTDHSDCSGTAGIASYRLSIIDYRAKGGRLYGRRRGRSNQRASARPTGFAFSGPCRCARLQRKASAAKAPHGRAIRRATAPSPTTRIRLCMGCLMLSVLVHAAPPPLPAEHLSVQQLPPKSPHWVYVYDEAFDNEIDARVHLFDGDSYRRLGQIDAGFLPSVSLSPDGTTTAVATTYFARGSRGARTDVVEFTDNATLTTTGEIVLPSKRAQTAPTIFNIAYSADGHFLYAAYVTPAASFGVLDPARRTVLGEIDTAGCVLVIPWGPNRVSSLCESGRLLTVTLDAQGHEAEGRNAVRPP